MNEISKDQMSIQNSDGYLTLPKSFVKTVLQYIMQSLSQSVSWIIQSLIKIKVLFLKSLVILSVSFDPHVGHDYIDDSDDRYDFYHRVEERIPFDLEYFNKITNGGLPQKTLNICLGTGVGKSLFMCHVGSSCLSQNQNVLYITLEMRRGKDSERIDANLLDISVDDLHQLPKDIYDRKINNLSKTTKGKLIVKEYPTH